MFSASQEIPRISYDPKVRYCIHKCLPPVPILSQLDPDHTPTTHCLKIHLNIILPSTPGFPKWSISLRFPHQNPLYSSTLPHMCYMPAHFILLDLGTRTILGEEYRSLSPSLSTRAAPKLMPPILFCWPTTSEANVVDMAVEVEPSRQYSVKFCCRATDDSRGAV